MLQFSDAHLSVDKSHCLAGLNTLDSFEQVLEHAKQRLGQPDLILATGDLVHDGSREGYVILQASLQRLNAPIYCLPGNHDSTEEMLATCTQGQTGFPFNLQQNGWSIVLLDSSVTGKVGGSLSEQQLMDLDKILSSRPENKSLVCLHHHPLKVGSAWLDKIALDNPEPFFAVIDKHPQVKGILYGHIHQAFDAVYKRIQILGSPSTCIQFSPAQDDFSIDDQPPGYRWLVLLPDGGIRSGVEYLETISSKVDLNSKGY